MPKISVHSYRHPKWKWVISRRVAGKRKRQFFESKASAEAEAARLRSEVANAGEVWNEISTADRSNLVRLYNEAKNSGLDLGKLLERALQSPAVERPALPVAVAKLIEVKTEAGRSPVYVAALKGVLGQFIVGRQWPLTLNDVEVFLQSKPIESRSTLRARLSTFFKFCIRRGWRLDNPCSRLEPITLARHPPAIFTPGQFRFCLQWLSRHRAKALPWFILTTCCGLRPEEAAKTRRSDINVREGWIKIEAQTTKVRQRRVVYPKPEAMALLAKSLKKGKLPLGATAVGRTISGSRWRNKQGVQTRPGLRQALGWKSWPRDITRHTAASYWLADCSSTAQVAKSLGHSETVLLRHYAALVTKEQAKQFWKATALSPASKSARSSTKP
jgi:integrase